MRFRGALGTMLFCTALVTWTSIHGCGRKEERQLPNAALEYFSENAGCLNEFGPKSERYLQGAISDSEWNASAGCAIESLKLFSRYIRGSFEEGYSPEDIRAFVARFLMTDREVRIELVRAAFEFKAALLGGSQDRLTRAELQRLITLLDGTREASRALIPHLYRRANNPSTRELLDFADALKTAFAQVADRLGTDGRPSYPREAGDRFLSELSRLFNWPVPTELTQWTGAIKAMLLGGSADSMEPNEWSRALRLAGRLGGPLIALSSLERVNQRLDRTVLERLFEDLRVVLLERLRDQGDAVSFERLDQLAERLPSEITQRVSSEILKRTFRPLLHKVLATRTRDAIDTASIELLFSQLRHWNRRQLQLERIFERLPRNSARQGVTAAEFIRAATELETELRASSANDAQLVSELIELAQNFRPLFLTDDPQITFAPLTRLSEHHLTQLNWIELAVRNLIRAYGNDGRVHVDRFRELMADYVELAAALGVLDTTVPDFDLLRFREANLFTYVSNGDDFIDTREGVYFVAFMNSSGILTKRTQELVAKQCPALSADHMGGSFYELACMRRAYYSNLDSLWDHFPGLLRFYQGLDSEKRREFHRSIEMAARPFGFSDKPVNTSDLQGFSTIPHYVEALLDRIDENDDQIVDLAEARKALPIFEQFLAQLGDIDPKDKGMLEAVFTYTIRYSRPPKKSFTGVTHFLWWRARKPFRKLNADRSSIYATIGALNDPKTAEKDPDPPQED
jgi:hypothetical protein